MSEAHLLLESNKPRQMSMESMVGRAPGGTVPKKLRRVPLGTDFRPGKYTVLCGRGKVCSTSEGNSYLKSLVSENLEAYSGAASKLEKTSIVSDIVTSIRRHESGMFVKFEAGQWWAVDDAFAREKIGCLFRDLLHTKYKSSTKSKMARRKAKTTFPMEGCMEDDHLVVQSGFQHSFGRATNLARPLLSYSRDRFDQFKGDGLSSAYTETTQGQYPSLVPSTMFSSAVLPQSFPTSLNGRQSRKVSMEPSTESNYLQNREVNATAESHQDSAEENFLHLIQSVTTCIGMSDEASEVTKSEMLLAEDFC